MKITNKKTYVQPQIGIAHLEDNLMDQNYASWVVNDGDKIPVGEDDDDIPEDAKQFSFDWEWDNEWEQDIDY